MSSHNVTPSNEVPCRRNYFYVGGEYVVEGNDYDFKNQMYVEQLDPVDGPTKPYPLVLTHGLGMTCTVSMSLTNLFPLLPAKPSYPFNHHTIGSRNPTAAVVGHHSSSNAVTESTSPTLPYEAANQDRRLRRTENSPRERGRNALCRVSEI